MRGERERTGRGRGRALATLLLLGAEACALNGLTGGGYTPDPPEGGGSPADEAGGDATQGDAAGGGGADDAPDGLSDGTGVDTANGGDSPADAPSEAKADAAPCNLAAAWGTPTAIAELNSIPTASEYIGFDEVSRDQLTAYIGTNHAVSGLHTYYTTRSSPTGAFGALTLLFPTAGSWNDWSASLTPDGLTIVVSSDRSGVTSDLYVSTRGSTFASFGAASAVSALNTSSWAEQSPRFSPDGQTFYFDSDRSGNRELYVASAAGGTFGAPARIVELGSSATEAGPVLSADHLTIYFYSDRAPSTDGDIWMATRASKSSAWGTPTQVASLNSSSFDAPTTLSADGCTMFLNSARGMSGGVWRAYVARRPP